MDYIVGQRWVSHADAQLGLGIVVELEGRRVTLSFPAVGEERTYATDNAPLTRLRFKVGDHIRTYDERELLVSAVLERDGLLFYRGLDHHDDELTISELELDSFVQLTTPQQRLLNGHFDSNNEFALRVATFDAMNQLQSSPYRGMFGSRTSLLEHQVYIAGEVGQRHAPRVLLADEVGLGKTIEAGMIVQQQLLTGRASRVLIIVPPTLLHQWLVEMLRRFNLHFSLFDQARIDASEGGNPFEEEQLILCSLDLLSEQNDLQQLALAADWDLVVLDEAHHLHWSPQEPGDDYLFMEQLSQCSRGLLLLTATPEQVGQASHFARLRLLDPARFHDLESFVAQEQGYRQLNHVLESLEQGGNPELPEGIDSTKSTDDIISALLDRYGTGRVLFRNSRTSVKGFPARELHRYPLATSEHYPSKSLDSLSYLHPENAAADDSWVDQDPRVSWLEGFLKTLRPEKALIICANASTAVTLEHYLHLRAGIRSAAFYEGLSILERDRAAAYFADDHNGAQTLVCSEIGSEGRNFQFVRHLILFDLPLNPDLLEQRIGRLDRIGQNHDVQIHLPYLEGTAQETLVDWYDLGLDLFRHSCSAGQSIIDKFRPQLLSQLQCRDDQWPTLLLATKEFTEQTRSELREGRDRLLERNSCNHQLAASTIEGITALESSDVLQSYLGQACEVYGVDSEYHSEDALILRPTDHMQTAHFPNLRDEGSTITFSRTKALAREDMEFMTWEHPMIAGVMDMVHSTELGNATIATIKLKGVPPATLLLETLYTANCVAPRELQVERFLPISPLRLLLNEKGKELSSLISHTRLNQLVQRVKKGTALAIIKQIGTTLESTMDIANDLAQQHLNTTLEQATQKMRDHLGTELERLAALQQVNPTIRDEEIDHLKYRIEECAAHIEHATLQLQALRLIITT